VATRRTDQSRLPFDSIWLRPERPQRGRQLGLDRSQIVRAAIEIADAEGLDAVTMRHVAAKLGVGTMSLYWHVSRKEDLLELMRDEVIGEVKRPEPPSGDWRADLTQIAYQSRATMRNHPWMMSIFAASPSFGPNMLKHADLSLAAVEGLGLDLMTMFQITSTVDDYVIGFTLGELNQLEARRQSGLTDLELKGYWKKAIEPSLRQAIESGNYPHLYRFKDNEIDVFQLEETFRFGLKCVLDGIATRIAEHERAPSSETS
jgi:AcrR family transcriptional regulator